MSPGVSIMRSIIFTDPIYQVMNFGSRDDTRSLLRSILDTQPFQRLRRISQLGLASLVFPGATHSRFSHCLGAAFLANHVLAHLSEREGRNVYKGQKQRHAVLATALLHDIGHGPFSHAFEQVLKGLVESDDERPLHEDWTKLIIQHKDSVIHRVLEEHDIPSEQVASVFGKVSGSEPLPRYLKQIVSSQLDVDRMDYLMRDSHFAGVSIGKVDVFYLIHCLIVVQHGGSQQRDLGLETKGVKAYEAFALARQLMNRTVYYHKTIKVLEFMMEYFLRRVIGTHDDICDIVPTLKPVIPPYFTAVAGAITNNRLKDKKAFMEEALDDYFQLTEDQVWNLVWAIANTDHPKLEDLRKLAKSLLERRLLKNFRIQPGKEEVLKERLEQKGYEERKHFAIVNTHSTAYKSTSEKVFIELGKKRIEEVTAISELISLMRDRPESESVLIALDDADELKQLADDVKAFHL
jgi:HD superfamily phosphohydrolase